MILTFYIMHAVQSEISTKVPDNSVQSMKKYPKIDGNFVVELIYGSLMHCIYGTL